MEIIIGSKNPAKIKAVQEVFVNEKITPLNVPSLIAPQPFSDSETRDGAINRATQCAELKPNGMGIGLEGGVMYVGEQLFLCNWGALVTPNHQLYTASGARILLPPSFVKQLETGMELGEIMEKYTKKKEVRNKEGAIGVFTNDLVSRKAMFVHVVTLLKGQWKYCEKTQ